MYAIQVIELHNRELRKGLKQLLYKEIPRTSKTAKDFAGKKVEEKGENYMI